MARQSQWDIAVEDLAKLREDAVDFVLIDVREPHEHERCNLGGTLIPLKALAGRLDELDRFGHLVVHCKSGGRSAQAVKLLRGAGFENAWNVNGGLLAWVERIDPSLPRP